MTGLLVGLVLGVLFVWLARRIKVERWVYSLGLLGLPLFYIAFALHSGDENAAFMEFFYGMLYLGAGLVFAISRLKFSAYVLAAMWLLHAGYDLAHGHLVINLGTPVWYPVFCAAVDVVVGLYLVWLARSLPEGDILKA